MDSGLEQRPFPFALPDPNSDAQTPTLLYIPWTLAETTGLLQLKVLYSKLLKYLTSHLLGPTTFFKNDARKLYIR